MTNQRAFWACSVASFVSVVTSPFGSAALFLAWQDYWNPPKPWDDGGGLVILFALVLLAAVTVASFIVDRLLAQKLETAVLIHALTSLIVFTPVLYLFFSSKLAAREPWITWAWTTAAIPIHCAILWFIDRSKP